MASWPTPRRTDADRKGRPRLIGRPWSRTGENPPYGILGGTMETSASFEARSAPSSYPIQPHSEFTGPCGTPNQDWVTAGVQAGSNATPYYAIFKNACPAAYASQF